MAGYTYNTRISLIKAGKAVNNRTVMSLAFIWLALIAGAIFLFINNANFIMRPVDDHLQHTSLTQTGEQSNEGAFVFVVRNKQMTLTKYRGFIEKGRESLSGSVSLNTVAQKNSSAVVVLKQKHNQPDFSIKKVPVQ